MVVVRPARRGSGTFLAEGVQRPPGDSQEWRAWAGSRPGGKVMHAQIRIGDRIVMMSDEFPEMGAVSPPTDMFWGHRYARIVDPSGHHWAIATHEVDMTDAETRRAVAERMASQAPPNAG
jgi:uncharacterized glyoxalase superfamily protein PhnB